MHTSFQSPYVREAIVTDGKKKTDLSTAQYKIEHFDRTPVTEEVRNTPLAEGIETGPQFQKTELAQDVELAPGIENFDFKPAVGLTMDEGVLNRDGMMEEFLMSENGGAPRADFVPSSENPTAKVEKPEGFMDRTTAMNAIMNKMGNSK